MPDVASQPEYYSDATDRIIAYLQGAFGAKFKKYFEGDPVHIPLSLLPCICVIKLSGETTPSATGTNDLNEKILIKMVYNKADDMGSNIENDEIDFTERKMRRMISARDPQTGLYLPGTVFGVLTTNFTLGNVILKMNLADEYDINYRPSTNNPMSELLMTSEAYITVDLLMRVLVPSRS